MGPVCQKLLQNPSNLPVGLLLAQVDNDEELAAANTRLAIAGDGSPSLDIEIKKEKKATQNDRITWASYKDFIRRRRNWTILLGCAGAWFFQDMAYCAVFSFWIYPGSAQEEFCFCFYVFLIQCEKHPKN